MPDALFIENREQKSSSVLCSLIMVVWQVVYNRVCSVELFDEEQAYHLMRKCHL